MQKPYTSYNPYFLVPFGTWLVAGGILLAGQGDEAIFKFVNLHHNSFLDVFMYRATLLGEGAVITLVLLILLGMNKLRNWWYFTAAILCNVLPSIITQVIKRSVDAPRPLKYFNEAPWIHSLPEWPRLMEHSFPSGHTCGAFGFFTFLALLLPARYRVWGLLLFVCALLVAYSRIYLAVHFMADVYVGSIIGTGFTLLVVTLMNRYQSVFFKKV
ncbi:MAG: phosphatase PAP2 family protein [Chitinophagales bacterium]|nr:phosphatase PAP2 family protein [Chitinophagales bacterium]